MKFALHSIESAPDAVKSDLEQAQVTFGMVPNLYSGFASSPVALKTYLSFNNIIAEYAVLTPVEQQVVYLTASVENGCTYCVAAHSMLATLAKMPEQTLSELRAAKPLSDERLNAIRNFTLAVVKERGWVPEKEMAGFIAAGYDQQHVLEVITLVAQKTLSNYFNHLAGTPVDDAFKAFAWEPE